MFYIPLYAETEMSGFRVRHVEFAFYLVATFKRAFVIGRLIAGFSEALIEPAETTGLAVAGSAVILFL